MIYVDDSAILYKGKLRYHMTADSLDELHSFATAIGVKRCWYHRAKVHPHYDITQSQRDTAVRNGANMVSSRELLLIAKSLVCR